VRVMTWNVQGRLGQWERRQNAISASISAAAPDLVLLQESWVEPNGHTQAALLAEEQGFHAHTAAELAGFDAYPSAPYWVVNAILSRWPLRPVRAVPLHDENGKPTWRHALIVSVERPGAEGGPVLAVGTHLEHGVERSLTRQAQMEHLLGEVATALGPRESWRDNLPAVVAGDFNAVPDSEELRRATGLSSPFVAEFVLVDAWDACGSTDRGATWSSENPLVPRRAVHPNRRLDYITTTAPRQRGRGSFEWCRLSGCDAIDGVQPSDHYAVLAEVNL